MKYKVGDKVKIRKGLLAGNIYTISHIESCGHIELSDLPYVFFDYELEPADSKTLRMADGTIIGEFAKEGIIGEFKGIPVYATGGTVSIHNLQTDALSDWATNVQLDKETVFNGLSQVLKRATEVYSSTKEEKNLKFTFYVTEGYRIDKSNNTKIPTMTTEVLVNGKDYQYGGSATCDKTDYEEREGVLNAIANAVCGGNFDKEFNKVMKNKAFANKKSRTCTYCGQLFAWHVERKKARRERYLLRKRAKEIAFEEQAQKMAKEIIAEDNKK